MTKSDQVLVTPEDVRDILAEHFDPPGATEVDWCEIHRSLADYFASKEQAFNAGLEAAAEVADNAVTELDNCEFCYGKKMPPNTAASATAQTIATTIRAKKGTHSHG